MTASEHTAPWWSRRRRTLDVVWIVFTGVGTGLLALGAAIALIGAALLHLLHVAPPIRAATLRAVRSTADRERRRLHRVDSRVLLPGGAPQRPADGREIGWTVLHGLLGLTLSLLGVLVVLYVLQDLTFPLWWWAVEPDLATYPWPQVEAWRARDLASALPAVPFGLFLAGVGAVALPVTALVQREAALRLLNPPPGTDLKLRVTELTATRAAALDAHTAELRRIERALHDGAQNRLVAVSVLLGTARRAVERGGPGADAALERAQAAVEDALADLRGVVREILPPVLSDRGLPAALTGLTERCAVPCVLDADDVGRCPAAIEATVYYAAAEALTNVSRHSSATGARVELRRTGDELALRVVDDGVGGANAAHGSGLAGIQDRVQAHDGTLTLWSPAGGPTSVEVRLPCGS